MRAVAIAVSVLLLIGVGTAFANPIMGDWLYIDFDPPNEAHETYPELFETVNAHVMFASPDFLVNGFRTVSFRLEVTPGMADSPVFVPILPGAVAMGEWYEGVTVWSPDCVPTDEPVDIGRLSFMYNGIPGYVSIEDHPDNPRLITDCLDQPFEYCVHRHGGVHNPGVVGDCGANPVQDVTWGAMKALFR